MPKSRKPSGQGSERARRRRRDRRAGRSRAATGRDGRRRVPPLARSRSAGRRRAAAPADRARHARRRGRPALASALAELDRRLAQFEEDVARERTLRRRRRSRAGAACARKKPTLTPRSAGQRRTPLRRRCARAAEADSVVAAVGEDLRRTDRRARRPHRAPQPARRATAREQSERVGAAWKARSPNIEAGLAGRDGREPARSRGARRRGRKPRRPPSAQAEAGGACAPKPRIRRRAQGPRRRARPARRRRTRACSASTPKPRR